jgi:hypothetical protein
MVPYNKEARKLGAQSLGNRDTSSFISGHWLEPYGCGIELKIVSRMTEPYFQYEQIQLVFRMCA